MLYGAYVQPAIWVVCVLVLLLGAGRASWLWRRRDVGGAGGARAPAVVAAVALAVGALVVPAVGVVPAGHRGVVYEWGGGVDERERGEGVTLLVPWVQTIKNVSVRTQKVFSSKVFAQSLDLQEITVVASVNYRVLPDRAAEVYQDVGPDYRATVVQPALFQRTKAAVGLVKAEDFASKRAELAETIQGQLAEQLAGYGIIVEFVNIEDAIFDPKFVLAVKNKVIAEQIAAEQERLIAAKAAIKQQTIIEAEARARSILIEANAQADANVLLAQSLTPKLLRWRGIVQWSGKLPTTLVGDDGATLLIDGTRGG